MHSNNGHRGRLVMGSGWKSEGAGFKPRWLKATFDPGLTKNIQQKYSQP